MLDHASTLLPEIMGGAESASPSVYGCCLEILIGGGDVADTAAAGTAVLQTEREA